MAGLLVQWTIPNIHKDFTVIHKFAKTNHCCRHGERSFVFVGEVQTGEPDKVKTGRQASTVDAFPNNLCCFFACAVQTCIRIATCTAVVDIGKDRQAIKVQLMLLQTQVSKDRWGKQSTVDAGKYFEDYPTFVCKAD